MPKPACVKCQRFYRPKQNGYIWTEQMPIGPDALPGTQQPDAWQPYKVWRSDLWECEGCGHQLISGHAKIPISEHYMPGFTECRPLSQVDINDC